MAALQGRRCLAKTKDQAATPSQRMDNSSQPRSRACCAPRYPMLDAPRRFGRPVPMLGGPDTRPCCARRSLAAGPTYGNDVASEATTIAIGGGLADRYAAALYAHADDDGALDAVVSEMEDLGRMIDASADFRRLMESPLIDVTGRHGRPRGAGATGLRQAGARFRRRHLGQSPAACAAGDRRRFPSLVADRRGIITAHVPRPSR